MMLTLTRGSRTMFRCLTRPSTVENSRSPPSRPTHTTEVCGLPSEFTVASTA